MYFYRKVIWILTKYGDFLWVSTEHVDVCLNPLKSLNLVHESVVPCIEKTEYFSKSAPNHPVYKTKQQTLYFIVSSPLRRTAGLNSLDKYRNEMK